MQKSSSSLGLIEPKPSADREAVGSEDFEDPDFRLPLRIDLSDAVDMSAASFAAHGDPVIRGTSVASVSDAEGFHYRTTLERAAFVAACRAFGWSKDFIEAVDDWFGNHDGDEGYFDRFREILDVVEIDEDDERYMFRSKYVQALLTSGGIVAAAREKLLCLLELDAGTVERLEAHRAAVMEVLRVDRRSLGVLEAVYLGYSNEFTRYFGLRGTPRFERRFALAAGAPSGDVVALIASDGYLAERGLISFQDEGKENGGILLPAFVVRQLEHPDAETLRGTILRTEETEGFRLEDFEVDAEDRSIVADILGGKGSRRVLLVGVPGTTKSEFARTVAASIGRKARFLDERLPDADVLPAFRLAAWIVDPDRDVIVIDEADRLLNASLRHHLEHGYAIDKGNLARFLDSLRIPAIWIANSVDDAEEAILRRFGHVIEFERFGLHQRVRAWKRRLAMSGLSELFPEERLAALAREYPVGPGAIALAVEAVEAMGSRASDLEAALARVRRVLERHCSIIGADTAIPLDPVGRDGRFDAGRLPAGLDLDAMAVSIARDSRRAYPDDKVFGAVDAGGSCAERAWRLLVEGPSGCGKTALARELASRAGVGLLRVRVADIMGGERPPAANIRSVFIRAAELSALVVLDEPVAYADASLERGEGHALFVAAYQELCDRLDDFPGPVLALSSELPRLAASFRRRMGRTLPLAPAPATTL